MITLVNSLRLGSSSSRPVPWLLPLFLFFISLTTGAIAGPGAEAWVEDVNGTNYVGIVQRELRAATGSVAVAMFEMRVPDDPDAETPSLVLVNELIAAHRRGVDVDVVLNLRSRYDLESDEPVRDNANGIAADMLAYAGVDVSYCPSPYPIHSVILSANHGFTSLWRGTENHAI